MDTSLATIADFPAAFGRCEAVLQAAGQVGHDAPDLRQDFPNPNAMTEWYRSVTTPLQKMFEALSRSDGASPEVIRTSDRWADDYEKARRLQEAELRGRIADGSISRQEIGRLGQQCVSMVKRVSAMVKTEMTGAQR